MTTLSAPPPRSTPVLDEKEQKHFSVPWSGWFRNLFNTLKNGKTEDVVIDGVTLHFVNGVYTGHE